MKLKRKFNWISSEEDQNAHELEQLQKAMITYYTAAPTRNNYNSLIAVSKEKGCSDIVTASFLKWLQKQQLQKIIEIGCGNGRVYKHIDDLNLTINYTGLELDHETIERNKSKWPRQRWLCAGVENIDFLDEFDLCFSFYVMEHLVYPKKALDKMFSILKPGGKLLLVFPDFSATKRLPSQHLGKSVERSTIEILKKGKAFQALLFYLDARRLSRKLKQLKNHAGEFLVNASPICLYYQQTQLWPDIDAVYLSHKKEIEYWAQSRGMNVEYPFGIENPFAENAFMVLHKKIDIDKHNK